MDSSRLWLVEFLATLAIESTSDSRRTQRSRQEAAAEKAVSTPLNLGLIGTLNAETIQYFLGEDRRGRGASLSRRSERSQSEVGDQPLEWTMY